MTPPPIYFGAFDRHNLGDILLGHMAAALDKAASPHFAGLADRDLTAVSGHRVSAVEGLSQPVTLIHVGGELLDCDEEQAAYMLGEPSRRWGRRAPYVVPRDALPGGSKTIFQSVGGVGLAQRDKEFRDEVFHALRQAERVSVRDRVTQGILGDAGITANLVPDPVSRIAEYFGPKILSRGPGKSDYLAVQFAAECGDDETLDGIARGLEQLGRPVVLFRAGAAPWHDDLEVYRRLASRLRVPVELFESLDIWDICGLIAGSQGFIGTSLHGHIVAKAFDVPAVSLRREIGVGAKLRAYLDTWYPSSSAP